MLLDMHNLLTPMDNLSLYRSDKAFRYTIRIDPALEEMRRLLKVEGLCNICLLLAQESAAGKGGHWWKGIGMCLHLWRDRKITCGLSILLSLL